MNAGIETGAWVNIVLGVLVIATPFFTAVEGSAFWNDILVGLLVIVLAGYNAWAAANAHVGSVLWPASANVLLGVWLILFPFFADVTLAYFWANLIFGALIVIAAVYNAWAASTARGARGGVQA